jgi:hypothetical protein
MKLNFKILLIAAFLVITPLFMFAQTGTGDTGAPPHPTDGGTVVGGAPAGAPIGNGTLILLTLAAAYAFKKVYDLRAIKEEEVTE